MSHLSYITFCALAPPPDAETGVEYLLWCRPDSPHPQPLCSQVMCKMGAIMAAGILDAGGRNVTIAVRSRSGYFRRTSIIGLAVFTQYW